MLNSEPLCEFLDRGAQVEDVIEVAPGLGTGKIGVLSRIVVLEGHVGVGVGHSLAVFAHFNLVTIHLCKHGASDLARSLPVARLRCVSGSLLRAEYTGAHATIDGLAGVGHRIGAKIAHAHGGRVAVDVVLNHVVLPVAAVGRVDIKAAEGVLGRGRFFSGMFNRQAIKTFGLLCSQHVVRERHAVHERVLALDTVLVHVIPVHVERRVGIAVARLATGVVLLHREVARRGAVDVADEERACLSVLNHVDAHGVFFAVADCGEVGRATVFAAALNPLRREPARLVEQPPHHLDGAVLVEPAVVGIARQELGAFR